MRTWTVDEQDVNVYQEIAHLIPLAPQGIVSCVLNYLGHVIAAEHFEHCMHQRSLAPGNWSLAELDGPRFALFSSHTLQIWDLSGPWTIREHPGVPPEQLARWWTDGDHAVLARHIPGQTPVQLNREAVLDPVRRFDFGIFQLVGLAVDTTHCWIEDRNHEVVSARLPIEPDWCFLPVGDAAVCVGTRTCVHMWRGPGWPEPGWRELVRTSAGVREWTVVEPEYLSWCAEASHNTHLIELRSGREVYHAGRVLHWQRLPGNPALGLPTGLVQYRADGSIHHFFGWYTKSTETRWHEEAHVAVLNPQCAHTVWSRNDIYTSIARSGTWRVHRNGMQDVAASGTIGKWTAYVQLPDYRLVFLDNTSDPPQISIMCFSRKLQKESRQV
jgi:hypothetical protein